MHSEIKFALLYGQVPRIKKNTHNILPSTSRSSRITFFYLDRSDYRKRDNVDISNLKLRAPPGRPICGFSESFTLLNLL